MSEHKKYNTYKCKSVNGDIDDAENVVVYGSVNGDIIYCKNVYIINGIVNGDIRNNDTVVNLSG